MEALGTQAQLAERLGVPERTVEVWRYKGIGPRYLKVGRHVRYRWQDVEAWLAAQRVEPASGRTA